MRRSILPITPPVSSTKADFASCPAHSSDCQRTSSSASSCSSSPWCFCAGAAACAAVSPPPFPDAPAALDEASLLEVELLSFAAAEGVCRAPCHGRHMAATDNVGSAAHGQCMRRRRLAGDREADGVQMFEDHQQ